LAVQQRMEIVQY